MYLIIHFCINTVISNEFDDLEQQQISVREQKKKLLKIEQEKQRTRYVHCKTWI